MRFDSNSSNFDPFKTAEDDVPFDTFDREQLSQLREQQYFACRNSRPAGSQTGFHTSARGTVNQFLQELPASPTFQAAGQFSSSPDTGLHSSPLLRYFRPTQPRIFSMPGFSETQNCPSTAIDDNTAITSARQVSGHLSSGYPTFSRQISFSHAPPVVQGIHLIETQMLPGRFRAIFPYPLFNAVQSKCLPHVYENDYNVVVSAPTGSGKTAIMELAICRLVNNLKDGLYKLVYQAPTKALCSERFRDWSTKFTSLGLQCAELTGDTNYAQSRLVQTASIIITTPEKWDSITRRWRDHSRLMQLVRLFLIDEVHVLNESRGAALEAVVTRMKSVGSNVRFIALSATIPNSEDIAAWLGRNDTLQHLPAHKEHFGEDLRPTKLQKFVYSYPCAGNDFAFDKLCVSKLPEIIQKHSNRKPIMIFCCTRNSAIATAKELSKLWSNTVPRRRLWSGPVKVPVVKNTDLRVLAGSGVAFHHAGLDNDDRHAVEKAFLEGKLAIICCTSTLAVGVNLPCYLVIIKNTVCWQEGGCKEYSDLEMMQMLGRAGRPQFDNSAVAIILTKKERVQFYEKMISGTEQLESCLHLNLIDHLNAEISLGTISDIQSAIKWLAGTFLFVRLRRNPTRYKLKENADRRDEDEMLQQICEKDINLLRENSLVSCESSIKSTPFGDAMARYYVKFETMKILLSLPPRAKISEILSVICLADEFHELRLKASERPLYREINRSHGIRFPIKVELAQDPHKISLLIQSELGAVDFPSAEIFQKHKLPFQQDKAMVFSQISRVIRCIIDCQTHKKDAVAVRNSLELARNFASRVWENSPLQMKQIEQIGVVAVRKLAAAGITTIQALEETEAHRIDKILSKNPPFGMKLLTKLADFPKLRVTVKLIGKAAKVGKSVKVNFKADIGFINEKTPAYFIKGPVYVCFVAEVSDGRLVDFRRMSAQKLENELEILLSVEVTSPLQHITCYVMCDEIGGTCQYAELTPQVPQSLFSSEYSREDNKVADSFCMNTLRHRNVNMPKQRKLPSRNENFEDDDLPDDVFLAVSHDFERRNKQEKPSDDANRNGSRRNEGRNNELSQSTDGGQLVMLENGKYKCNHKCKDRATCKHFCCREGLDKPPKIYPKITQSRQENRLRNLLGSSQDKTVAPSQSSDGGDASEFRDGIDYLDLTQPSRPRLSKLFLSAYLPKNEPSPNPAVVSSRASRMANLDVVSSLAKFPESSQTLGKSVKRVQRRKRSHFCQENSSSEYDDSSLDDFFSPGKPAADEIEILNSCPTTQNKRTDSDSRNGQYQHSSSSHLIGPGKNALNAIKSSFAGLSGRLSVASDNLSTTTLLDMGNMQVPSEKEIESDVIPGSDSLKRKAETLNNITNDGKHASKRSRAGMKPASVGQGRNEVNDDQQICSLGKQQVNPVHHLQSQEEDISLLLLQELGEMVNFSEI